MNINKVKQNISKFSIFLILIFLIALLGILKPDTFLTTKNLTNLLKQMTTIGIMAFGVSFPILAGGTDLSGGAVVGLTACAVGLMVQDMGGGISRFPMLVAILITVAIGALAGLCNGLIISYGNAPPFIATLGMQLILRGASLLLTDGMPVTGFVQSFKDFGSGSLLGIPYVVLLLVVLGVFVYFLQHKTKFGSYVYAIGGNERAAAVSGINTKLTRTLVHMFTGIMAALAGIVLAARTMGALTNYGEGYDMDAISCVVIGGTSFVGGKGTLLGTVCGILIIGLITNGMTMLQVNPYFQFIVKGLVILIAVLIDQRKERKE